VLRWFKTNFGELRNQRVQFTLILLAAILPAGLRVAMLPWRHIPEPSICDEFGHLLVADTLVSGRLANPTHPLWRHLDTLYVLQRPTYSSIYPIGQGALLSAGKLLGHPWLGVVLSVALMCGALAWVLSQVLPLKWVALGIAPIAFSYGLQWIDSYWGGSLCALGGALLFGAIIKLHRSPSVSMAIVAAVGWSIVWFVRPFESLLLLVLLWSVVGNLTMRAGSGRISWIAPITLILLFQGCAGGLTLAHNYAVTGTPTSFPYVLSQRLDGVPQSLAWQSPVSQPEFRFAEMKKMYLRQLHQKNLSGLARAKETGLFLWNFFIEPWFVLPLFLASFAIRERNVAIAWGILLIALATTFIYPYFFPHYIAAYTVVLAFLIVRGLMTLAKWNVRSKPTGYWCIALIILSAVSNQPVKMIASRNDVVAGHLMAGAFNSREYIVKSLQERGGAHVVFVRYGKDHSLTNEWVYNAANIDDSKVVWVRWMGAGDDTEVMRYYPKRQFWIVDVNKSPVAVGMSDYRL